MRFTSDANNPELYVLYKQRKSDATLYTQRNEIDLSSETVLPTSVPVSESSIGMKSQPVVPDLTHQDISTDNVMTVDYIFNQMNLIIKTVNERGLENISPEDRHGYEQVIRDREVLKSLLSAQIPATWQETYLHNYKQDINYFTNLSGFFTKHLVGK